MLAILPLVSLPVAFMSSKSRPFSPPSVLLSTAASSCSPAIDC